MALIVFVLLLGTTFGCADADETSEVKLVGQKNPPSFKLSGDANLLRFCIYEIPREKRDEWQKNGYLDDTKIWCVSGAEHFLKFSQISEISYGVIPQSYIQEIPGSGKPSALAEGKLYVASAHGSAGYSFWVNILFNIKYGKVKETTEDEYFTKEK